jgi:hypothetical protein
MLSVFISVIISDRLVKSGELRTNQSRMFAIFLLSDKFNCVHLVFGTIFLSCEIIYLFVRSRLYYLNLHAHIFMDGIML